MDGQGWLGMSNVLPHNIEAEQALLGAIFVNNACFETVNTFLTPEDFYEPIHRKIFALISDFLKSGKTANPVTLKDFMPAGTVGSMTMSQYLAQLAAGAIMVVSAEDFGRAIYDRARMRDIISMSETLKETVFSAGPDISPWDVMASVESDIRRMTADWSNPGMHVSSMADAADAAFTIIDDAYQFKKKPGFSTGVAAIDDLTGPWSPEQQIIIGAATKQGKSSLMMQCAVGLARYGGVYVYSGEMSLSDLAMREVARRTGIPANRQKQGRIAKFEWEALVTARSEVSKLPIFIDRKRMTLEQILARAREIKRAHGLVAVAIDHVGLLAWGRDYSRHKDHELAAIATTKLKDIYAELKVAGMTLVQLKKNTFAEPYVSSGARTSFSDRIKSIINRRPRYTDLLGSVEQDADHVIMPFNVMPILAGLEPAAETEEHYIWEEFCRQHEGKAEIILGLSREQPFPQRRTVEWHGETTSFGPRMTGTQESMFGDGF